MGPDGLPCVGDRVMGACKSWTPEEIEALKNAQRSRQTRAQLANQLGRSKSSISYALHKLGLTVRNWTSAEVEYLEESWGEISIPGIAKHLNRNVNSIKQKAQEHGLTRHLHYGVNPTLEQVWAAIGIQGSTGYNTKRFIALGLPVHKHKVVTSSFRTVDIDEFWEWAEKNKRLFDFRNFEENALGAEPAWVKKKRREDIKNFQQPHNAVWTPAEDSLLIGLLKAFKHTYSDISKRLNRSEGAIKRRIHDLKLKQRPLREAVKFWTEEEKNTLIELWDAGWSYERIGEKLGRTALAVRGKHENIVHPEWAIEQRQKRKERKQRAEQVSHLIYFLKLRRNALAFGEYWQKDMCMLWDPVKGCTANEKNCDECISFRRIRPQYCRRCGITVMSRQKIDICDRCKKIRKWQHRRKVSVIGNKEHTAQDENVI